MLQVLGGLNDRVYLITAQDGGKVPFPFHGRNYVIIPKDPEHFFVEELNC